MRCRGFLQATGPRPRKEARAIGAHCWAAGARRLSSFTSSASMLALTLGVAWAVLRSRVADEFFVARRQGCVSALTQARRRQPQHASVMATTCKARDSDQARDFSRSRACVQETRPPVPRTRPTWSRTAPLTELRTAHQMKSPYGPSCALGRRRHFCDNALIAQQDSPTSKIKLPHLRHANHQEG